MSEKYFAIYADNNMHGYVGKQIAYKPDCYFCTFKWLLGTETQTMFNLIKKLHYITPKVEEGMWNTDNKPLSVKTQE